MTPEEKRWIDNASLVELLRKWRHSPADGEMFQGETGEYYSKVMFGKRDADNAAWVRASKEVGWG
jgi:hypothetical protein